MAIKSLSRYKKNNIFNGDFLKVFEDMSSHCFVPEFIAVLAGIKPVFRTYAIHVDRYPIFQKICKKYSIFVEFSDFRISSNDWISIVKKSQFVFAYFSKYKKLAKEAKDVEYNIFVKNEKSYKTLLRFSQLMGYPKCCFDFFLSGWKKIISDKTSCVRPDQFEYISHQNTKEVFSFYLNNLIKGNNYYLISHLPHSYNCKPSIEYAKKVLTAIKKVNPEIAEKITTILKYPVMKFLNRGQYLRFIKGKVKNDNEIVYEVSEGDDKLNKKFIKGNKILAERTKIKIFKNKKLVDVYNKKNKLDGVIFDFK
ncbi:MAG: hypothetical protein PHF44_03725 [Candidatus Pacebacteria bacterium]|nr:hypothetical protein [Candidatus Paceibacterota bacterium]